MLPTRTKRGRLPIGPCGASGEDWTSSLECKTNNGKLTEQLPLNSPKSRKNPTGVRKSGTEVTPLWGINNLFQLLSGKHSSILHTSGCKEQNLKSPERITTFKRREGWHLSLSFSLKTSLLSDANLPFEGVPKSRFILISPIAQQVLIHHVCLLLNLQSVTCDESHSPYWVEEALNWSSQDAHWILTTLESEFSFEQI